MPNLWSFVGPGANVHTELLTKGISIPWLRLCLLPVEDGASIFERVECKMDKRVVSLISKATETPPLSNTQATHPPGSVDNRHESAPTIDLRPLDDQLIITDVSSSSPSAYVRWGKRTLDICLSSILLVVLSPVFVVIACLVRIRLGSGGIIFRQRRIGLDGREFTMFKFRSMLPDRRVAERSFVGPDRRTTHKSENDPRHRPFGRFLRAASLDELPQLLNVLVGEMSLVGPRPEVKEIVLQRYLLNHPRHKVRPGITGPFQVSVLRFEGRLELGFEMDTDYASNIRLSSDCRYLLRTLAAPFTRRGR